MMRDSLEKLRQEVEEYSRTYRHPDLPSFRLRGPYALFPENDTFVTDPEMRWDKQWPNSDSAGVYAIFSQDGTLLYIGKAWFIGRRLASYFQYEFPTTKEKRCHVVHTQWTYPPTYVCTIAVPETSRFEACALEEYLIHELKPLDNIRIDPHWKEDLIPAA